MYVCMYARKYLILHSLCNYIGPKFTLAVTAAIAESVEKPFTINTGMHVCLYVCMYICMYVCMYVYLVMIRDPIGEEVLVKVVATGLCHTDFAVKSRDLVPFPIILGHG